MVRACPHTPHHNERRAFSLSQDTALLSASASYDQQQQEMFITNIVSLKGLMQNYENLLLDEHDHVKCSSGLRKDRRGPDNKCQLKCGNWMKDLATGSLYSHILGC